MAQMIPESIPSGRPKGERDVFDILQKLPDDYLVYYEPIIKNRYPDFVVVCPDQGLMVIEVKDWLMGSILSATNSEVKLSIGGETKTVKHPQEQVKGYKFDIMNRFKGNPAFDIIKHSDGKYAGGFLFPFGHMVVLSKITSDQLHTSNLSQVFPEHSAVTKDVLDKWVTLDALALASRIGSFFNPSWPIIKLSHKQIGVLRATIHPEIIVRHSIGVGADSTDRLLVLDKNQEMLALKINDGHRIINGVAGAGKTVLLIHRARWLGKEEPARRILILCFNKFLSAYIGDALNDVNNVKVLTFHKWGVSSGANYCHQREKFGNRVMVSVMNMKDVDKYDAILIDEAQDFDPTWFRCCVQALKDPVDGDLIVVADGNQGLYRPVSFTWKEVGIKATGRVIPLMRAYRNTEQILHLARSFASEQSDSGESIVSMKPGVALLNGPLPILHHANKRADEMDRVTHIVKDLLNGNWGSNHHEQPLKPSEIGIIYARKSRNVAFYFSSFLNKLPIALGVPVVWLSDKDHFENADLLKKEGIKIQTIQSAKGLQYKAVIFIWADQLPMKETDESLVAEDRRLFYVGLTRAERYLAVTYTGQSKFTKILEETAKGKNYVAFYCEHCGYHAKATQRKVSIGKQFVNAKCKCGQTCKIEVPLPH